MKNWLKQKKALLITLLLVAVTGAGGIGCLGTSEQPRGWSGAVLSGNTMFVVSLEGKLVTLDITTHNRTRSDVPLAGAPASGGGFGCAAPAAAVAVYGTPAVSGNMVYVGGYDGRIHAFNTADNSTWTYPDKGSLKPIAGGLVFSGGVLYFGDADGKLYALDAVTRTVRWDFATGDKIWCTPTVTGGTVYIGSFDKKLYAINAADGSKRWDFETGGVIISTPLVYNGTVYVGSFDRHVYAVNAADGSLKWKSADNAGSWFWVAPVAANNAIYAGNLDGKLYVFSEKDGSQLAAIDLGSPVQSSPVTTDDAVVVVTESGQVYSVSTASNQAKPLTKLEPTASPLYTSGGVVYVHTLSNDTLYAINAQNGVRLWNLQVK